MTRVPGESIVLAIDTAGSACSAAVSRGGEVLAAMRCVMRHGHGETLLPMIDRVMAVVDLPPGRIDVVAAATGPGGFTGIRVGLAAAHGIALATGARLVGITSFAAVAAMATDIAGAGCRRVLVALDSRREDLYVQLFTPAAGGATPTGAPQALRPAALAAYLATLAGLTEHTPLAIAGDAAAAAAAALERFSDVTLLADSAPDASGVAIAALRLLRGGGPIGAAQPLYLRPPDVTLPPRRPPVAAGDA